MITVHKISLKHSACRRPIAIREAFLTTDYGIMWMCRCLACKVDITIITPLEELIANCPVEEPAKFTVKDISDLHQLGICLPDSPA